MNNAANIKEAIMNANDRGDTTEVKALLKELAQVAGQAAMHRAIEELKRVNYR